MATIIQVEHLAKTYFSGWFRKSAVQALKGISLELLDNEVFALVGPNGAGKTTFVRLLMNFIKPTSGVIQLFGQPHTVRSLHDSIGYFPERVKYPPRLTIRQFLLCWGQFSGLEGNRLFSRVNELLKFVKLEGKRDSPIRHLSKGELVRVGLAQALLNNPRLLILDEPIDGLDPLGRIELRQMLLELRARGTTILMNSHLLSEVEQISTRVGIMNRGEIVAVDELSNLISSDGTRILFHCPSVESISKLRETYSLTFNDDHHELVLANHQNLGEAIGRLSSLGGIILGVNQRNNALEEKFISLIKPRS